MAEEFTARETVLALAQVAEQWALACSAEARRLQKENDNGPDDYLRPIVISRARRITELSGMCEAYGRIARLACETADHSVGIAPKGEPAFTKGPF